MRRIITTVGASLFTNFQQDKVKNKYGRDYASIAIGTALAYITDRKPKSEEIYDVAYKHHIQTIRENIEDYWFGGEFPNNEKASAEISSIIEIAKEEPSVQFEVHLVATDTLLSVLAAEMICNWFHQHKHLASNIKEVVFQRTQPDFQHQGQSSYVVKDLRTDSQSDYERGVMNLLDVLNTITTQDTVLNITGGYKAIVPIVTVWAQIRKVNIKYLFDEDNLEGDYKPLTMGNLPINFDYSLFEDNYVSFESIKPSKSEHNLPTIQSFQANLSDSKIYRTLIYSYLIKEENEKVRLSPLGEILYKAYEDSLEEDGFNMSNLVGKIMELKVFEYFKNRFPKKTVVLGHKVGKSPVGDAYDLDVTVKDGSSLFWGIEVKPEGASILITEGMSEKKKKSTIEYKCKHGAFKSAFDDFMCEDFKLSLVMYHHKRPNDFQQSNIIALKQMDDNPCKKYFDWFWVKPKDDYKGNVNWSISENNIKIFNFLTHQWEDYV
jgi:hypothetical protein